MLRRLLGRSIQISVSCNSMWVKIGVIFVLAFDSTGMGDRYLCDFSSIQLFFIFKHGVCVYVCAK